MADYSDSKFPQGDVFPDNAIESSWDRLEPLIDATKLKIRHLFGLPLVSQIPDPITKKHQVMTDSILDEYINMAIAEVEAETNTYIFPVQFDVKYPFDRPEYVAFGYFRTLHRPVSSIDSLVIRSSDGQDIFSVPSAWIDPGGLPYGQINIIPLTVAMTPTGLIQAPGAGGALFLSILGSSAWVPSFWSIKYTCGYPNGNLPKIMNMLVGIVAAMKVLSTLSTTYSKSTSASLAIDGASQSFGSPGPNLFKPRLEDLQKERDLLTKKIRQYYSPRFNSSNV